MNSNCQTMIFYDYIELIRNNQLATLFVFFHHRVIYRERNPKCYSQGSFSTKTNDIEPAQTIPVVTRSRSRQVSGKIIYLNCEI